MDTKTKKLKQMSEQDKITFGITEENLKHFIMNNEVKFRALLGLHPDLFERFIGKVRPQINNKNLELLKKTSDIAGVNVDDNSFNVFLENMLERELEKEKEFEGGVEDDN